MYMYVQYDYCFNVKYKYNSLNNMVQVYRKDIYSYTCTYLKTCNVYMYVYMYYALMADKLENIHNVHVMTINQFFVF